MRLIFGGFIVLHGLIHLLYFGQAARYFQLKPGMAWPDGSWALSGLLGDEAARTLASVLLLLSALGLIIAGIGVLATQAWWRPVTVSMAVFSSVIYILLWNRTLQNLDGQGAVGILIDVALLLLVLVFRWPQLGF